MKALRISLLLLTLSVSFLVNAETESAKPTLDVSVKRNISYALIEGIPFYNVTASIKAWDGYWIKGVRIIVRDNWTGKRIYKKSFPKAFLYGFSDGTLQIGQGNVLIQTIIFKDSDTKEWYMQIKKKGIY